MKKVALLLPLLCFMLTNTVNAQTNSKRVNDIEKKLDEAYKKAMEKQRKEEEEKQRKEEQQKQQRKQHEADFHRQMDYLNQVSAKDFIKTSKQQGEGAVNKQQGGFSTKVNNSKNNQQTPIVVATPRMGENNRPQGTNYGNSGKIGTPSYSGNDYTGDRYKFKPAGFGNKTQSHQTRMSANQYRNKYPSQQHGGASGVVSLHNSSTSARVSSQRSQQQKEIQNKKNEQPQEDEQKPDGTPQPLYFNIQQTNSSPDLAMVNIANIDNAKKKNNFTISKLPNDPYKLSNKDNKELYGNNIRDLSKDLRSKEQQYQLMRKDLMNGMSSFEKRRKWEDIYDYDDMGKIKIPSNSVTQ